MRKGEENRGLEMEKGGNERRGKEIEGKERKGNNKKERGGKKIEKDRAEWSGG